MHETPALLARHAVIRNDIKQGFHFSNEIEKMYRLSSKLR
jgi:hypothetical protein